jgi:starch-binding outer membrane protein SusE/F
LYQFKKTVMKQIIKFFTPVLMLVLIIASCNKVKDLPLYQSGDAPVLSASAATLAPVAADSNETAITFSWTNPKFATDSSNYKFIVQIDSAGRDFSKAVSKTVLGSYNTSYTNKEINQILLGFGFAYNTAYDIDVRVIASYRNNNDQKITNTIRFNYKIYVNPPKIAPPSTGRLFLVGNASQGGWNNPVPVPTQEFGKIDSVTYVGVFDLNGGTNEYLVLPSNGSWDNKYSVANKTLPGLNAGGDFGFNLPDNFPGPSASGMHKIVLDFQAGKFIVTPYTGPSLPANLFIVGNATPGGWNNPVPVPSQQLTRLNSVQFETSLALTGAGNEYLLLPVNGSWANKYSVPDKNLAGLSGGGFLGYNLPDNLPAPADAGTYKISVNFGINDPANPGRAYFKTTKLP